MRLFGRKSPKANPETPPPPPPPPQNTYPAEDHQNFANNNNDSSSPNTTTSSDELPGIMLSSDDMMMMNGPHPEDEISLASGASEIKAWDEGGSSDCGYSETFHSVFMSVGQGIYGLVGSPSDNLHGIQKSIGNWFQELSYATRDIVRGENAEDMQEDAATAMRTLMGDTTTVTDGGMNHLSNLHEEEAGMTILPPSQQVQDVQ